MSVESRSTRVASNVGAIYRRQENSRKAEAEKHLSVCVSCSVTDATPSRVFNPVLVWPMAFRVLSQSLKEVNMSEKELSQLALLDEFSIMELEERLEFEAWCNTDCSCVPINAIGCVVDTVCPIILP